MVSFSLPVNTVVLCLSWSLTHVFPVAGNKFPNVWTCRRTEFTSSSLQWLCRSACDNTPFLSPSTTGLIPTQCCLGWQKERSSLVSSVLENLPALVSQHGPAWMSLCPALHAGGAAWDVPAEPCLRLGAAVWVQAQCLCLALSPGEAVCAVMVSVWDQAAFICGECVGALSKNFSLFRHIKPI